MDMRNTIFKVTIRTIIFRCFFFHNLYINWVTCYIFVFLLL